MYYFSPFFIVLRKAKAIYLFSGKLLESELRWVS